MVTAPIVPTRRLLPVLYLVSGVAAVAILAPLLPGVVGAGPRYLLFRDAVSTPRSHLTDTALGVGDLPPRAVPQDWFVAVASSVVDGGALVTLALLAALILGGVGYGRLAARLLPGTGRVGPVVAALVSIWNPYVAERFLQGHWSLLIGYAALGWILVAVTDLRARPGPARLLQLAGLLAVAGLTPSGSLLALAVLCAGLLGRDPEHGRPADRRVRSGEQRWRTALSALACWLLSALPWLLAGVLGGAVTTSGGADVFGIRSEPWLGPVGTVVSLGGLWNADAVPASRTIGWAAVATVCLLIVVGAGLAALWRRRADWHPMVPAVLLLGLITAVLLLLSTAGPVRVALDALMGNVGGAGLLRDTQKFSALLVPAYALAAAAAAHAAARRVPAGFAFAGIALLVVAPLPDLAWGAGSSVRPIDYPDDWARVAEIVPPDSGSVALWPPGTVRRYGFAHGPSLDPAARMLRAPVVESGALTVDGKVVDPPTGHADAVATVLGDGGSPAALAELGVGWVLVENGDPPDLLATGADLVHDGDLLQLYRIDDAADRSAGTAARATATAAHLVWVALIGGGVVGAVLSRRRRR